MSKTLYALTRGEYDDYEIVTLTDDCSRAEKLASMYNLYIEPFEDGLLSTERTRWRVHRCPYSLKVEIIPDPNTSSELMKVSKSGYVVYVECETKEKAANMAIPLFEKWMKLYES